MKFTIIRDTFTTKCTIGCLSVEGGTFECYTLEDVARPLGVKIYGQTAIPSGKYKVRMTFSNRFQRELPLIYNESDWSVNDHQGVLFEGVRFHSGNTHEDTHGCILPGMQKGENMVYRSRDAMKDLLALMNLADVHDLEIINQQK